MFREFVLKIQVEFVVEFLMNWILIKKQMLFLSIPKPCHENWDEMSHNEQGAFCKACSKIVVDFTTMNEDEVRNYLFQSRHEKTCGRFRNDQLMGTESLLSRLLARPIPFWKKFLGILLILFSSFLNGCEKPLQEKESLNPATVEQFEKLPTTILGYIMPETVEIEMAKPQIEKCSVTMDTTVVIIGDTVETPIELPGDKEVNQDTVQMIKPNFP